MSLAQKGRTEVCSSDLTAETVEMNFMFVA